MVIEDIRFDETTSDAELLQIHQLNRKNLKTRISEETARNEGFVTWLYSEDLLRKVHRVAPAIIAKQGDSVIGYALVTLPETSLFHADLKTMIDNLSRFEYKGRTLNNYTYYVMGQVCIDRNYRGKGVFEGLYQKHKELYSDRFELLVTKVSSSNIISLRAHSRVGFKNIGRYADHLDEWLVMVWDWS